MSQDRSTNYVRLAVGAGVLAVAALGLAICVPRRRWAAMAEPVRRVLKSPLAVAMRAWAAGLWREAVEPGPPVFNDLRPFDEF